MMMTATSRFWIATFIVLVCFYHPIHCQPKEGRRISVRRAVILELQAEGRLKKAAHHNNEVDYDQSSPPLFTESILERYFSIIRSKNKKSTNKSNNHKADDAHGSSRSSFSSWRWKSQQQASASSKANSSNGGRSGSDDDAHVSSSPWASAMRSKLSNEYDHHDEETPKTAHQQQQHHDGHEHDHHLQDPLHIGIILPPPIYIHARCRLDEDRGTCGSSLRVSESFSSLLALGSALAHRGHRLSIFATYEDAEQEEMLTQAIDSLLPSSSLLRGRIKVCVGLLKRAHDEDEGEDDMTTMAKNAKRQRKSTLNNSQRNQMFDAQMDHIPSFYRSLLDYVYGDFLPMALPLHDTVKSLLDFDDLPDAFVTNDGTMGGTLLAEVLKIPTILLSSPMLIDMLGTIQTSFSSGYKDKLPVYLPRPGTGFGRSLSVHQRIKNVIHEKFTNFLLSCSLASANKIRWEVGLSALSGLADYFNSASAIIVDTAFGFEYLRPLPSNVHLTGPLMHNHHHHQNNELLSSYHRHAKDIKQQRGAKSILDSTTLPLTMIADDDDESFVPSIVVSNLEMDATKLRSVVRGIIFARSSIQSYAEKVCSAVQLCSSQQRHISQCDKSIKATMRKECNHLNKLSNFQVTWLNQNEEMTQMMLPPILPSYFHVESSYLANDLLLHHFRTTLLVSSCSPRTVSSALVNGVPSVCIPLSTTQLDVAARVMDNACGYAASSSSTAATPTTKGVVSAESISDAIVKVLIGSTTKPHPANMLEHVLQQHQQQIASPSNHNDDTTTSTQASSTNTNNDIPHDIFIDRKYMHNARFIGQHLLSAGGSTKAVDIVEKVAASAHNNANVEIHPFQHHSSNTKILPYPMEIGLDLLVIAFSACVMVVSLLLLCYRFLALLLWSRPGTFSQSMPFIK